MLRISSMCKKVCIYLIATSITIVSLYSLLISREDISVSTNAAYDVIRAPVKDTLDRKKLENALTSKKNISKHNSSSAVGAAEQEEKNKVVVQIDRRILTLIEEIEQKDTTIKGQVKYEGIKNYTCPQKPRIVNGVEDLLCMRPPKFLSQYKNPCWNTPKGKFHCLPYFQVIGVDKCGSTDLFDRIAKHPDVLKNNGVLHKETMWWSWKRYGHWLRQSIKVQPFERYIQYFDTAAKVIQSKPSAGLVTGDGTPMDIWDMSGWGSIPQNNGLKEPQFITPHLIKHVNPGVKLIVIVRDPVERLFSDYFFLKLGKMTIQGFHNEVIRSIKLLHSCTRRFSLRICLYSRSLHVTLNARIHLGFYSLILEDWLKVFTEDHFLILRTEDYSNHTADHLQLAYTFLGLRNLPKTTIEQFASTERKHVTKNKKKAGKMFAKTRLILERLYESYNRKLADIINDDRFSWKHAT